LSAGRLLDADDEAGDDVGGLVIARRSSSGGGDWRDGGGESLDGAGDKREEIGASAANGLLRGGLSTLLISGAGLAELGAGTVG
jgi:hypothetical protein